MDNFLTLLYSKRFEINQEHKTLMEYHDFPNENENIRNDQKISDARIRLRDIDFLILNYINICIKNN